MAKEKTPDRKLRSSYLVKEIFDFINRCSINGLVNLHNEIFGRGIHVDEITMDGNEGKVNDEN